MRRDRPPKQQDTPVTIRSVVPNQNARPDEWPAVSEKCHGVFQESGPFERPACYYSPTPRLLHAGVIISFIDSCHDWRFTDRYEPSTRVVASGDYVLKRLPVGNVVRSGQPARHARRRPYPAEEEHHSWRDRESGFGSSGCGTG